jgi:hypothetical protein
MCSSNNLSVILDLDEPNSISSALYALFDDQGTWACIEQDYNNMCSLFNELAFDWEYVETPIVRRLREETTEIIQSTYRGVVAYHACRPLDRNQYMEKGVLRTTEALLWHLTKEVFGETHYIQETFSTVCQEYLKWYDGTIGLFLSAHEKTSWHRCSCFLGKMASAIGENGHAQLGIATKRSRPTMVKCLLPLSWAGLKMRTPSLSNYVSAVLQKIVLLNLKQEDPFCDFGALGLRCDIPPEMIAGFIDVET